MVGLVWKIWFGRFGLVGLVWYVRLSRFGFAYAVYFANAALFAYFAQFAKIPIYTSTLDKVS